jgi:hypothetical protein
MSDGLPINVLPEDPNWSPTPQQLSDWKSNYPNSFFKANASNPDWVDSNGNVVSTIPNANVASTIPISPCGFAVYEWKIVSGIGEWVEIENRCRPGCNPVRPLAVPGAMPLGMQIANPCN